jgi:MFS family permease
MYPRRRFVAQLTTELQRSWFDYALHFVGGSFAWRFPLAFQIVFAAIVLVLLLDLPESPRWLYKAGRQRDATQALCRVFDQAEDSEFIRLEQESIAKALELESRESSNSWLSLFKNDAVKTRRRVLLAYAVMVCALLAPRSYWRLTAIADIGSSHRHQPRCLLYSM